MTKLDILILIAIVAGLFWMCHKGEPDSRYEIDEHDDDAGFW